MLVRTSIAGSSYVRYDFLPDACAQLEGGTARFPDPDRKGKNLALKGVVVGQTTEHGPAVEVEIEVLNEALPLQKLAMGNGGWSVSNVVPIDLFQTADAAWKART